MAHSDDEGAAGREREVRGFSGVGAWMALVQAREEGQGLVKKQQGVDIVSQLVNITSSCRQGKPGTGNANKSRMTFPIHPLFLHV